MLGKVQFWVLMVLSSLTALLIVGNMARFSENRRLQAEVNERAMYIQQTAPLESLSREIALALAQLGVQRQDPEIQALLSSLGITVTVNPSGQPESEPPPVKGGKP